MTSRWLTNLEDLTSDRFTDEYKAHVQRTYDHIRMKHGDVVIGPPQATEERTREAIAADGIVGIYLPGTRIEK